jgi:hypothetical protein
MGGLAKKITDKQLRCGRSIEISDRCPATPLKPDIIPGAKLCHFPPERGNHFFNIRFIAEDRGKTDRTGPTLMLLNPFRDSFKFLVGKIRKHRSLGCLQQFKRRNKYPSLKLRIIRGSQRTTQLKRNPEGTWRADEFGMFPDQTDLGGGDAFCLQIMCQRANGARAERSDRNQKGRVHMIPFQQ